MDKNLYETLKYENINMIDIANYFLLKENMSYDKINSLCYYSHAWYLALNDNKISEDSDYYCNHKFNVFNKSIDENFKKNSEINSEIGIKKEYRSELVSYLRLKLNNEIKNFLDDVWETYGCKSGFALKLGISRETPYLKSKLLLNVTPMKKCKIFEDDIKEYYLSIKNGDY